MESDILSQTAEVSPVAKLRSWIATTKNTAAEIGLDANLIAEGVLDSIEMVNFLLYIEEIRGEEIPEELIQPSYFVSLRVIQETFFAAQGKKPKE